MPFPARHRFIRQPVPDDLLLLESEGFVSLKPLISNVHV